MTLAQVQAAIAEADRLRAELGDVSPYSAEGMTDAQALQFVTAQRAEWDARNLALAHCRAAGWRPMASAPRDGTLVLASDGTKVREARSRNGVFWQGFDRTDPTHWQPLPEPPTPEAQG